MLEGGAGDAAGGVDLDDQALDEVLCARKTSP
jgi:hypothetical protein